ncbi:hypothetical protein HD806DRAFT_374188 [Xylariaceae sp. AK1471]|nr:hypothetical protein HD806DRAFT_374188 [Xylariaceae sp. AK1471]
MLSLFLTLSPLVIRRSLSSSVSRLVHQGPSSGFLAIFRSLISHKYQHPRSSRHACTHPYHSSNRNRSRMTQIPRNTAPVSKYISQTHLTVMR